MCHAAVSRETGRLHPVLAAVTPRPWAEGAPAATAGKVAGKRRIVGAGPSRPRAGPARQALAPPRARATACDPRSTTDEWWKIGDEQRAKDEEREQREAVERAARGGSFTACRRDEPAADLQVPALTVVKRGG